MAIVYRVDLEDQTGSVIAIINDFISLSYTRTVNKKGSYTLSISGYDDTRLSFADDYIIRVWMKDEAENIPWTNVFNGIHKTYTDTLQENGNRIYTSFGPDGMELIESAEVQYYATSAGADKTAVSSTAMIAYVSENATATATTGNGRFINNTKPLTTAPDTGIGPTWSGAASWDSLLETLQNIRQHSINNGDQCDFTVDYLGGYAWQFSAGQVGTDRTAVGLGPSTNGLNGAGNVPVIFGPAYGNVSYFSKSESRYNEANSITVIGQGQDTSRDAVNATDTASTARSPIAQRERVINGNNIAQGDTAALTARAEAGTDEYTASVNISFIPRRGAQILFRDYFLYDFVTAEDFDGNRYNQQITQISVTVARSVEATIERQKIEFSDT